MRPRHLLALIFLALLAISLAGALARSQTASDDRDRESGEDSLEAASPQESPESPPPAAAAPSRKNGKKPVPDAGPRIVRWVCTDRICGGCDGHCSRHGHVATSKGGHCACTPEEGSALDQAIREAFEGHENGR